MEKEIRKKTVSRNGKENKGNRPEILQTERIRHPEGATLLIAGATALLSGIIIHKHLLFALLPACIALCTTGIVLIKRKKRTSGDEDLIHTSICKQVPTAKERMKCKRFRN